MFLFFTLSSNPYFPLVFCDLIIIQLSMFQVYSSCFCSPVLIIWIPRCAVVKNLLAIVGNLRVMSSTARLGRLPGEGHGNPLQYSFLENPGQRSLASCSPLVCKESNDKHTHAYSGEFI